MFDFSAVLGFILYPSSYNISVIGVFRSEKKTYMFFAQPILVLVINTITDSKKDLKVSPIFKLGLINTLLGRTKALTHQALN